MKVTKNLTHIATPVDFEQPFTEEDLLKQIEDAGIKPFRAELDIAERTEDHVQMLSLEQFLGFAQASGVKAVTYDITYFPHADDAEVTYQLRQLGEDLDLAPDVIREVCAGAIEEYLAIDAKRNVDVPVHNIVECYVGGTAFAWYGVGDYPRLKRFILRKLAQGGTKAKREFVLRASRAQADLIEVEPAGGPVR